jgi:type II secretory pathway component GspD/PulD (secretin)
MLVSHMLARISSRLQPLAAQLLLGMAVVLGAAGPASSQPVSPRPVPPQSVPMPQNMVVEVIQLRYRTSQELIPILQPMLVPGAGISGLPGQLVVRTTPANLEDVKRILAGVDTMPRQFLITVRQDADMTNESSAAGVSGNVGGERGRVIVPGSRDSRGGNAVIRQGDSHARIHIIEGRSSDISSDTQSVRVMEGREAFVRIGQSIPVRGREVRRTVINGQVVEQVVDSTQYRDLSTGFYVRPRISGERVTLDLSPQREALSRQGGAISVQSVVTTVSGRIGEWMDIGSVGQDASGQETMLFGSATGGVHSSRRVQVKVDEVQ